MHLQIYNIPFKNYILSYMMKKFIFYSCPKTDRHIVRGKYESLGWDPFPWPSPPSMQIAGINIRTVAWRIGPGQALACSPMQGWLGRMKSWHALSCRVAGLDGACAVILIYSCSPSSPPPYLPNCIRCRIKVKGTVAWDFCPLVLFINQPYLDPCLLY